MMDALKQKFGEQNPEERDRRKKQLIGINFFQLALCLTMVIIGVQYNDLEDCRSGDAPKYLLLGRVLDIMSSATCVAAKVCRVEVAQYSMLLRDTRFR